MWLLSPPCQPYTRLGKQRDTEDKRSDSFIHLIRILENISKEKLPSFIFVENVKNFEKSQTRDLMVEMFKKRSFHFREFLVNSNLYVPNSRLRYYCIVWTILIYFYFILYYFIFIFIFIFLFLFYFILFYISLYLILFVLFCFILFLFYFI